MSSTMGKQAVREFIGQHSIFHIRDISKMVMDPRKVLRELTDEGYDLVYSLIHPGAWVHGCASYGMRLRRNHDMDKRHLGEVIRQTKVASVHCPNTELCRNLERKVRDLENEIRTSAAMLPDPTGDPVETAIEQFLLYG